MILFSSNIMSSRIRNEKDKYYKWYKNGKLHREDGPAIECDNGDEHWFYKGKKHRLDGPAVVRYYKKSKEIEFAEWWIHGVLHRNDGPASISPWCVIWFQNNKIHRVDGLAYITNNRECWYYEGKKHRLDGPSVNIRNGELKWYFHGIKIEKDMIKHHKKLIKYKKKYIKALQLNDILQQLLDNMILDDQDYYKIRKDIVSNVISD